MKAGHNWMQHPVWKRRYKLLAQCDRNFKDVPPGIKNYLQSAIFSGKYDE